MQGLEPPLVGEQCLATANCAKECNNFQGVALRFGRLFWGQKADRSEWPFLRCCMTRIHSTDLESEVICLDN